MALLVGPTGRVVGVEKHPELAKQSEHNLHAAVPQLLQDGTARCVYRTQWSTSTIPRCSIHAGNVLQAGLLSQWGPFDAIHVGAAAASLPTALVRQLRPGGRMVIPVGPRNDYQAAGGRQGAWGGRPCARRAFVLRALCAPDPSL